MILHPVRYHICYGRGFIRTMNPKFVVMRNSSEGLSMLGPSSSQTHGELSREIRRRYENLQRLNKKRNARDDRNPISQIESIAAQQLLKSDEGRFAKIQSQKKDTRERRRKIETTSKDTTTVLPLSAESNREIFETIDKGQEDIDEKGFFVSGDEFAEDYSMATTTDMPEDDMTEPSIHYYGDLDSAAEDIDFQLPGQIPTPKEKHVRHGIPDSGDWMSDYGITEANEDEFADLMIKDAKCAACGAQFHCHNPSLPGFVPLEMFREIENNSRKDAFDQKMDYTCRRCYLLKEYNFLLNLNVCQMDYVRMMGHLRLVQEALVLLIVDMTDLQGSIHHELPKIIGSHKPMIVVGNKVDLLPPDTRPGYLRHYRDCLRKAVVDAGISRNFNVLKYILISAKTGFGVEDMITNVYQNWIGLRGVLRSDMYMIGATNAGKSTLFNALIQSDLCKVRAMDLVERVTTSIWPGTTLSLLKFPLMNPTPQGLEIRRRRLLSMQAWAKKEEQIRRSLYRQTKDAKYIIMQGHVGSTFKENEENSQPISTSKLRKQFEGDFAPTEEMEALEGKKGGGMSLNDRVFQKGRWCYDTPGTVNRQQVSDLFTLEELINVIPRSIVFPRIFILFPGQSLFLGTVATIDVLQSSGKTQENMRIYASVFASPRLKTNVVATKYAQDFIQKNRGDPALGAPVGDAGRLEKFPKLEGVDFDIEGGRKAEEGGVADVVLSSLGWVLVTTEADHVKVRASTPAGKGLMLRQPPLVPYAADYREKRLKGTAEYTIRSLVDIRNNLRPDGANAGHYRKSRDEFYSPISSPSHFVSFDLA